jgi:hypothetical protein
MAKASSGKSQLSATLWSLVFAVCLALAAAHLSTSTLDQEQGQTDLIKETFTQAPGGSG